MCGHRSMADWTSAAQQGNPMMRLIGIVLLLISIASPAQSAPKMYLGIGVNKTCGAWTAERRSSSHGGTALWMGLASWTLGFLSGLNVKPDEVDFLVPTDTNAIWAWIDNYCRAHPLDTVIVAAHELSDELRRRAKR